jgi:transcriptional regulator with XRE-family HTH domain
MTDTDFAALLASERRRRRWSQQELSVRSGVSQRHISFLEQGRSAPGSEATPKLMEALELDFGGANRFLAAAGLAPARITLLWDDPRFAAARHAVTLLLAKHEPFPGMVTDQAGDVLMRTKGLDVLLERAGWPDVWQQTGRCGVANLYDLTLHPHGIITKLTNPAEVVPHTLRRLAASAATNPGAARTYVRVTKYPAAKRWPASKAQAIDTGVVTENYVVGARRLSLVSVRASFASAEDVTAHDTHIELLYPADAATERSLLELTR